jgi:hypothetical protein
MEGNGGEVRIKERREAEGGTGWEEREEET